MTLTASVKLLRSLVVRGLLPALAFLASASLWGGVMFTDSTFNLSDYSIITWKSDPSSIGISIGQTQTGGNPGQALQILYSLPPSSGNSIGGLGADIVHLQPRNARRDPEHRLQRREVRHLY